MSSGIRFDSVTVAYDGNVVLDALDLTVEPGEVMALLGPSGSGKTTALRAVAGFVRPVSGRVYLGERDVTELPPHRRDKIQYSTPGVAGDGTAVLIKAMHDFGGEKAAMDYLAKLQGNNVGPSASTGKLAPKVDKGELLVANGDVQMNFAQAKSMPNLAIWFPATGTGRPTTFALPYAVGLVTDAPHSDNAKKLLDFMLSRKAQQQVSEIGGGFSARQDTKPDANAIALTKLMDGVEVFEPDWADIDKNLTTYVDDWKDATGS